ncbi:glycosyltransferase involved in cell wall biosynthesis [Natronocella acetinitrilica]|uniref:Glycosyltransferase involved in cell wall biosynthesis n=1 Tax=Natronocella acetinitrilica TaxID=414046 RepID=A0AAE3G8U3_9GAMM|nr:glycosyltransferase [Natronocella acetinitrilica]MCP1677153.1 glycosyltransferase involved in cell wall biosynthesis [Natronocella acetinitrilica]
MSEESEHPLGVLLLIDHYQNPHAGTEGQLYSLAQGLVSYGVRCELVALQPSAYLESGAFPCPVTVLGHSSVRSFATWRAMYRLGRQKRKQGYRLAHTFFNDSSLLAPPMFRLAGVRTIISRRDMGYWYTPTYKALLRQTGRFVTACVVNSQAVKEITAEVERIPPERIHVIPNGVREPVSSADGDQLLAELRGRGHVLAGIVANIRPIKRIADLVNALALIRDDVPALDVVIVGGGDVGRLREVAAELGVGERVHFLGSRSDVAGLLPQLDVGVLCSESEGFSNAIVEYMQAGLPVVCTRTGGNPEAVTDGRTGFLYPVGDIDALSQSLLTLARDEARRHAMGAKARQEATTRYSVGTMVDVHLSLYRQLLVQG